MIVGGIFEVTDDVDHIIWANSQRPAYIYRPHVTQGLNEVMRGLAKESGQENDTDRTNLNW